MTEWRRTPGYRAQLLVTRNDFHPLPKVCLPDREERRANEAQLSYAQFVKKLRVYRPSDVIEAIASLSSDHFRPGVSPQESMRMNQWSAAMIVRDSLLHGNEKSPFRKVGRRELDQLVSLHGQIFDETEFVGDQDDVLLRMLTSIFSEQMPAQESVFEELARSVILFRGGTTPEHAVVRNSIENRFEMPLDEAIGSAFALFGLMDGLCKGWDVRILDDPSMQRYYEYVPKQSIAKFATKLTATRDEFAALYATAMSDLGGKGGEKSHRWGFNPLTTHPIVRVRNGSELVPLRWLIARRLTPSTLYYDGLAVDKTKFTDALGRVSEDYVGAHLNRMTEARVTAEFKYAYKGEEILSIDWFVELPQCLILVESKSLRMTLGERLGRPPKDSGVLPTLKHAFEQIDRDMRELTENKRFDHLPRGLPLLGMVVTAEPIYLANSPLVRKDLPESVAPIIVISHRELARMVTVDGGALGDALLQVVNDDDRKTWGVMESLSHVFSKNKNPVLREAANQLPIFNLQRHRQG